MFELENMAALQAVADVLESVDSIVLTCHVRPDGDALGSLLGLGSVLESMGKRVTFYCQDRPALNLAFLPGIEKLVHDPPHVSADTCLVVLDCSEEGRIGEAGPALVRDAGRLVVIDHHLGQDMCGSRGAGECVQYINPEIFATGAICVSMLEYMGADISTDVATCLYTAILTDTGSFRHSNTTPLALRMAAALIDYGADPYAISDRVFERASFAKYRLLARVLENMSIEAGGRAALIHVTGSMLLETGADLNDTDDFVRYPRSIDGVEVSAFIKEVGPGRVSVSMRSRSWFNVAELAKKFDGGGHFHAAGFRMRGNALEWRRRLAALFAEELARKGGEKTHA